jgi:hypothetical protein
MRFQVSDLLAGKSARCKRCGNGLRIPEPRVALASVAASGLFRMGTAQPEQPSAAKPVPSASADRPSAEPTSLRLVPIPSLDGVKPVPRTNARAWEGEESIEYEVDWPAAKPVAMAPTTNSKLFWGRGGIGEILLIGLRKISDFGYLISITFLLLVLLGIVLKQRELAIITAVVVVLTNITRLALDGFVLVTLAFRKGILQGVLFFIPPFTFYLAYKSKVLREALRRFLAPALPMAFLLLLFVFVPRLRGEESREDAVTKAEVSAQQDAQNP